jgi:hypothetical protein
VACWPLQAASIGAETALVVPGGRKAAGPAYNWRAAATCRPALALAVATATMDQLRLSRALLPLARAVVTRLPALLRSAVSARELSVIGERALKYPLVAATVLLAHAAATAPGAAPVAAVVQRVRRRGVGTLWRGFLPLACGALFVDAAARAAARLLLALLAQYGVARGADEVARGLRLGVVLAVRTAAVAALQPAVVLSRHMLLADLPLNDALAALFAAAPTPLAFWAGAGGRAAAIAVYFAVHLSVTRGFRRA